MLGLLFMALAFFSLLVTLSWDDVSVVGPASASLTFIANAFAARIFLKERVDHRRWLAAAVRGRRRRFAGAVRQESAFGI